MNFVVPALDGTRTGGTLYNRELIQAMERTGAHVRVLDVVDAAVALRRGDPGPYWIDSLYLEFFAELRAAGAAPRAELSLIAHYLPTLVERGVEPSMSTLRPSERIALEDAHSVLVTSRFMRQVLGKLGVRRTIVVEPGTFARGRFDSLPPPSRGLSAIIVANYLPGKDIQPFLSALGPQVRADDGFQLEVIGSSSLDPEYALRCHAAAERYPELRRRTSLCGSISPEAVVQRLEASNLLVSPSRMETFGMVIAEARTLGLPVLARRAGNIQDHVVEGGTGLLVDDCDALARAFLRLARAPNEHEGYLANAQSTALPARSWRDAASEFLEQLRARKPDRD